MRSIAIKATTPGMPTSAIATTKPLKQRQIWAIRFFLDREGRMRDRALFDLAIDSKLRGCDLVKMKIGTLVAGTQIRTRAIVIQQKTGRPVQFEITAEVRASLLAWLERRGGTIDDYAFPSRVDRTDHLSTRQYAQLVDEWVTAIGLRCEDYGTHSLRRTNAAIIYKATGNLARSRCCWGTPRSKIRRPDHCLAILQLLSTAEQKQASAAE
ncbi:integrase [Pararhizobium capsulatum DSM 1112]|uniref:Integrase n=1 Tax=Pararhizobium capsulatum DSM 1112 TaxID=1121113 RepID=A0ABU0C2I6_9HYPH|nr:integrase [Pararhizobium capsulatum DSM 1112]